MALPSVLFILTTFLQLFLLNRYFNVLLPSVVTATWQQTAVHYTLSGGILFFSSASFFSPVVTGGLSVLSSLLVSRLYVARLRTKWLYALLYLILGFIAESVSYALLIQFNDPSQASLLDPEVRLYILLASALIMLLFIKVIQLIHKETEYRISSLYYLCMATVHLGSLLILHVLCFHTEKNSLYIFYVLEILLINLLLVLLFDHVIKSFRLADEKQALSRQMLQQKIRYEQSSESFARIQGIVHDTKKQLVFFRTCLLEQRTNEALKHVNDILEHLGSSYLRIQTGHLVIDALVSQALNQAHDLGVDFDHHIRLHRPAAIDIDHVDLCTALGNLLDNAIEAVNRVPQTENRFIRLDLSSDRSSLRISVCNSKPFSKDTIIPRTSKTNPADHGYGLSNIRGIAEKYNGYFHVIVEPNDFQAFLMIPFSEKKPS